MLGGKKTPRARPQERARAADAKPNASKPLTQAPGGKPRARRKGAKATRQPVARTHERARPAAKPTRPTTERRPAGAGATAPHHAPQRRRDHASGRRNGGEAGGDGAGRAALGRDCWPPTPCHQRRKTPRKDAQAASAADAEREGQGAPANPPELLGLHPLGRGRARQKRGAAARRPPTAFRCRRSGWADGVSLPSLPRFMACGEQLSPFCRKNAQKGEKRKKGLVFVYVIVIYSGHGCMSPTERSV